MGSKLEFDVLTRYLTGELRQEERQVVENWISESRDNERRLRNLEKIWAASTLKKKFSSEQGWHEIKTQLKTEAVARALYPVWARSLQIAAAVLLLIVASWMIKITLLDNHQSIQAGSKTLAHSLVDGSSVTLNQNSTIEIEDGYGTDNRQIKLTGEAYFEVESGIYPFMVEAGLAKVVVVGTEFNIQGANDPDGLEVSVFEGIVEVQFAGQIRKLEAGQKAILSGDDHRFVIRLSNPNDIFWKTRRLSFNNIPLAEAIEDISVRYNRIIALDPATRNCFITTKFDQTSLEDVLTIIASMYNLEIIEQQEVITLSGPGCEE